MIVHANQRAIGSQTDIALQSIGAILDRLQVRRERVLGLQERRSPVRHNLRSMDAHLLSLARRLARRREIRTLLALRSAWHGTRFGDAGDRIAGLLHGINEVRETRTPFGQE